MRHAGILGLSLSAVLLGGQLVGGAAVSAAEERVFYVAAVELKGGVSVEKEPYPSGELPKGGGYVKKAPDAAGRWEVSVYQFSPATIVVRQGDRVTLEIAGINGAVHNVHIDRYHPEHLVVKRGQIARIKFIADSVGLFKIHCLEHPPTMEGSIVVLPR